MSTSIDSLSLEISSNSKGAVDGIKALEESLGRLKNATSGLGLKSIAKGIGDVKDAVDNMGNITNKLNGLARAVKELTNLGNIKVSASIGNQITKIGTALSTLNIGDGANKIQELVSALRPLETLGKSSLSSTVNALNKLPEALQKLDTRQLYTQIQSLTRIMQPLATEMEKIANGFNAFPSRIQKLIKENEKLNNSNQKLSTSYVNLWAKCRMAYTSIKSATRPIAQTIKKSSEYNEVANRFTVSMGQYAQEHHEYAQKVGEVMGIDPAEWMGNEATFMALSSGFGIAGDRAATMSQQLTQLGYDIASFHDLSFNDAMLKLQSGLAGELEPLRRIGYDLSVARLQQEAYTLGINKKVSAMTQAEKAELRYYTIMKQSTLAMGDMARTLEDPANQMRIFKSQVEQTARSIGNLFIPILMKVLPIASAVVSVLRSAIDIIAGLFGYEFPEIEWNGVSSLASGAEDASDALSGATDNAKKLKKYTMGFDELNVIDTSSGSGAGSGAGVGGGFGFELPTYDFIDESTKSRITEITENLKEWLGITDEIDTWAELFHTKLGKILIAVGLIGAGFLAWKVISGIVGIVSGIAGVFSKIGGLFGGKNKGAGDTGGDIDTATQSFSNTTAKLKELVKNLALGIVIIAEVIIAAALVVGGIWLLGAMLEQVGLAWQPVIDNAGTIAIAMVIGTALLVGIGFATAALGKMGKPLIVNIGIGTLILAELGVATGLFLAEILGIGLLLQQIGEAWQPVLDNGETITTGIAIGTGLLIGIGVVTALLGAATVSSAGALPIAIGLGTAILVELAVAFKKFCDSLIDVADKLVDDLHPSLDDLNDILPDLNDNMEDFTEFMIDFADMTVDYTKSSAISGFASTVDTIIGFFTKDPIKSLADDAKKQYDQSKNLNKNLEDANPELQTAITNLGTYKSRIDSLKAIADTIDTSDMATTGFTNLVTIGSKIADFGKELKKYYEKIKDIKVVVMDNMVNCINDIIDFAVRIKDEVEIKKIDDFTDAIKRLTTAVKELPTSKTLTINAIYNTTGSKTQKFADGGFPETGQLFIAREAGAEMVGNIGRRTAVANNDQIVAGIASGVASANTESNSLLREQNSLLRAMLEKETGVYLDGKRLTNSVEKYQSQRGRQIVVGGAY